MADAVSPLPFTTEFQVKPGRTGVTVFLVSCRMAAAEGAFNMPFDLTTLICVLRNSANSAASKDD